MYENMRLLSVCISWVIEIRNTSALISDLISTATC